jgi:hypothetical protein
VAASLLVGILLALGSLAYVLYPLLARKGAGSGSRPRTTAAAQGRDVTDEEIEAAIRSYRARASSGVSCSVCGLRPESDAIYCSSCGRRLAGPDAG